MTFSVVRGLTSNAIPKELERKSGCEHLQLRKTVFFQTVSSDR